MNRYTQRTAPMLFLFVGGCLAVGALGGIVTASAIPNWYAGISKPEWNPPNWIFGPMWTTLYIMMGVAAWLVWRRAGFGALRVFGFQLALNGIWSPVFFGLHEIGWALLNIVLLWAAIGWTIQSFFKHSRWAAGLLVPYWLWVSFATVLNSAIWQLNR